MKQTLNKLYSRFKQGEFDRSVFEGLIYRYLINNQDKTCVCHWNRDEYEDFISWFYPRLKLAVDTYTETGSSFEAFIARYLLISSKEFHVRNVTKSVIEYSAWSARLPEMYAHEDPPFYLQKDAKDTISSLVFSRKGRKESKRILALILKCYYYISDDFAEKIAPLIGIETEELKNKLNEIRDLRHIKDDKIFNMRESVYRQFYRCIVYEKRYSLTKENTVTHEKLKIRLEKARKRLEKMRGRMRKVRTEATNKEISEILGTTKGTVDAGLCRLKLKWEAMSKKAGIN